MMERSPLSPSAKTPEVSSLVSAFTPLTLAAASLIVAVICIASKRNARSRGSIVLLVGPPDAGKTAILSTFVYGKTMPTVMSLQANSSVVAAPSGKTFRMVDVPGHPRMRDQFQDYLSDSRVVLFVVDASTISRNGSAVAEHLHHVLHAITSLPPSASIPALVILAHKIDLLRSTVTSSTPINSDNMAITRVKTILERELEKRRASQSGGVGVEGLGEEGDRTDLGGLECNGPSGGIFKFDEWEGGEVVFLATSVKIGKDSEGSELNEKTGEDDGLFHLRDWLKYF